MRCGLYRRKWQKLNECTFRRSKEENLVILLYVFLLQAKLNYENTNIGKLKNDVSKLFLSSWSGKNSSVLLAVLSTGLQGGREKVKFNKISSGKSTKS